MRDLENGCCCIEALKHRYYSLVVNISWIFVSVFFLFLSISFVLWVGFPSRLMRLHHIITLEWVVHRFRQPKCSLMQSTHTEHRTHHMLNPSRRRDFSNKLTTASFKCTEIANALNKSTKRFFNCNRNGFALGLSYSLSVPLNIPIALQQLPRSMRNEQQKKRKTIKSITFQFPFRLLSFN